MPAVLDHVFVFCRQSEVAHGSRLRRSLEGAGLSPSFERRHLGQGTANLCYVFDNAYLELLFVVDRQEIAAPAMLRSGLSARARWTETGASPFGIGLRSADPLPFRTWGYRFAALPPGMIIPIAADCADHRQPFLFGSPGTERPDRWTDGRAGMRQTLGGFAEIAAVDVSLPPGVAPCDALSQVADDGVVSLAADADTPRGGRMTLVLSRTDGGAARLELPSAVWF